LVIDRLGSVKHKSKDRRQTNSGCEYPDVQEMEMDAGIFDDQFTNDEGCKKQNCHHRQRSDALWCAGKSGEAGIRGVCQNERHVQNLRDAPQSTAAPHQVRPAVRWKNIGAAKIARISFL
jgi:hypothetical protein